MSTGHGGLDLAGCPLVPCSLRPSETSRPTACFTDEQPEAISHMTEGGGAEVRPPAGPSSLASLLL